MSGWYDTGYGGKVQESNRGDKVFRFWMRDGDEGEITFVDDDSRPHLFEVPELDDKDEPVLDKEGEPVLREVKLDLPLVYSEHQLHLDGHWRNWFTCLKPLGMACPICAGGDNPAQCAAFTIIDHREWTDKQGNKHKDELKLYIVKTSSPTYKLVQKLSTRKKGLRGVRVEVSRVGAQSANVGNSFDFLDKVELPDTMVPINYLVELKPRKAAALAKLIGGVADSAAADEDKAESIPWQ